MDDFKEMKEIYENFGKMSLDRQEIQTPLRGKLSIDGKPKLRFSGRSPWRNIV